MKLGKLGGTTGRAKKNPAAERAGAPVIAAAIPNLGIPEQEFTPKVRNAVSSLTGEIDRLRQELEQVRARLDEMAHTADQDMLLPILNRRAFVREIARFIAFAERYSTPSSILYFDLDNFKAVNDEYGHAAGDAVLRHFANLLMSQIRDSDILARIGGDEFAIILAHVTLDQAKRKAETLAEALRERPPVWNGRAVNLAFSCGAYELRAGESVDAALVEADQAMYTQKHGSKRFRR